MELLLKRKTFTDDSTVGELYIDGKFECFCIEDRDRGLTKEMPLSEITAKKVYGKTAIPKGRYEVALTFSDRFKKYLPLVIGVPGYEGIRIHPGNTAEDSLGCILPGKIKGNNVVQESKVAFEALYKKLKANEKTEKLFITIS